MLFLDAGVLLPSHLTLGGIGGEAQKYLAGAMMALYDLACSLFLASHYPLFRVCVLPHKCWFLLTWKLVVLIANFMDTGRAKL